MSTHSITFCDVCGVVRSDSSRGKRWPRGMVLIDMTSADGQKVSRERWEDLCQKCHAKAERAIRKALGKGARSKW